MAGERVLVIDDGKENRDFVVEYVLKPGGYDPLEARDGAEGLQLARTQHPDLILLDLQMPRMNGVQVLEAMRAEALAIPVILMTFYGSEEVAVDVFRLGVRDYVKKPYTIEEMLNAINNCLADTRLQREKEALTNRLLNANRDLHTRLRDTMSGGGSLPTIGQTRTAAILHVGLRGLTSVQSPDAASYLGVINLYISVVIETITRRGGTLFNISGESVAAVFNAPDDLDQFALRAGETARAIFAALGELRGKGGDGLNFAIGVDMGVVITGGIGVAPNVAFTVLGDTATLARRLADIAQPGQALFSANMLNAVGNTLPLVKLGDVPIKGRPDPLSIYTIKGR